MSQNVVVYGLVTEKSSRQGTDDEEGSAEEPKASKENCKALAYSFITDKLKIQIKQKDILVAHRMGKKLSVKPHPMVIKCSIPLREIIFTYTKNLKGIKNSFGDNYVVRPQLPEPLATQRKERDEKLKEVKTVNAALPDEEQHKAVRAHIDQEQDSVPE